MADSKPTPPEVSKAAIPPEPDPVHIRSARRLRCRGLQSRETEPRLADDGPPRAPKRLPSRNWMIFLSLTAAVSGAIIYDKREKNRATARWARAVAPSPRSPSATPAAQTHRPPRGAPGDGLRVAQDHFLEYIKPILAASGLDWEFVQGRQQGDVRAAVAEKIRRRRSREERPDVELLLTEENIRDAMRQKNGIPEHDGPGGDIVIGRHTWKEYVRGLHEGWLGPSTRRPSPRSPLNPTPSRPPRRPKAPRRQQPKAPPPPPAPKKRRTKNPQGRKEARPPAPAGPPQHHPRLRDLPPPAPHPAEFSPSDAVPFPHLLGFAGTFTRMQRFLNRRRLADDIGRQVAAACFAASREWREDPDQHPDQPYEQQRALEHEERNWVKSVWKEAAEAPESADEAERTKERIWTSPVVVDPRIATRMRRFEIRPEDEERAKQIVVPEEEIEGWIKGSLRSLGRWGWDAVKGDQRKGPNVGEIDE
ncbi:LOW QUALITY PROTEIN: mitochondrial import inner membrane translocase subunit TIM54 [Colletotrichum tofieldiae]|nr:LOW QUALITY PROTEIN: mitochondrial import inner membrane translocase subunit TIM54 [Colletotrichum tofieldiae]